MSEQNPNAGAGPDVFSSPIIDEWVRKGATLDSITWRLVRHPENKIEIQNGEIRIYKADALVATYLYQENPGELVADDWLKVAGSL